MCVFKHVERNNELLYSLLVFNKCIGISCYWRVLICSGLTNAFMRVTFLDIFWQVSVCNYCVRAGLMISIREYKRNANNWEKRSYHVENPTIWLRYNYRCHGIIGVLLGRLQSVVLSDMLSTLQSGYIRSCDVHKISTAYMILLQMAELDNPTKSCKS